MIAHRHYNHIEIEKLLKENTDFMRPTDIKTLSKIFGYLTFAELKRVCNVVKIITRGRKK